MLGLAAGDGRLYVALYFEDAVAVYDRDSGKPLLRIENVSEPRGLALDPNGSLYVVSETSVIRMTRDGKNRRTVVAGLEAPWDVAVDPEGLVYVTDLGGRHQVRRFEAAGKELSPIGPPNGGRGGAVKPDAFVFPFGIAVNGDGQLLVADFGNGRVQRFAPDGGCTLSVMAAGFGGNNGGVATMPATCWRRPPWRNWLCSVPLSST